MTDLADAVLPLIRTRADLHRWGASNDHGRQMHEAVAILELAALNDDPTTVYAATHQALASAIKVIARADDSSGIIGDACRRLLDLHPKAAAAAKVSTDKLIDWMMKFQFDGEVDYFELDVVAYAAALGEKGTKSYRARLNEIEAGLGPRLPRQPWEHNQVSMTRSSRPCPKCARERPLSSPYAVHRRVPRCPHQATSTWPLTTLSRSVRRASCR